MEDYRILSLSLIIAIGLVVADGTKVKGRQKRDAEDFWKGPKYKSEYWGTGQAFNTLGGLASYRQREMYKEDPNREPTVCFNSVRPRNGYFAYFICPERFQSDAYVYCCGDDGDENCCHFWQDGGRVAGVVIAILVFVALVVVGIVLLCKFKLWPRWKSHEKEVERQHHNPTLDAAQRPGTGPTPDRADKYGVPLTSVSNHYEDYRDYKVDKPPIYRPTDSDRYSNDRRSDTSDHYRYDSEPRHISSKPYGHQLSSKRSYDSEPRGYYSETSSRRSRRSDRDSDLDTKHSFRDDKPPAYDEPVKHSEGSKYSDFDTLGSPVAKHPPGLPPHSTAV